MVYLKEHIKYEREMLRFTYDMLFSSDGKRWCAMFESFGLHARNLYDFLRNEGGAGTTFRAVDYARDHKKPGHSNVDGKMNASFFHLHKDRLEGRPVDLSDAIEIGAWIDREWAKWAKKLGEAFQEHVDTELACPAPSSGPIVRPSATNIYHDTTTTIHSTHSAKL